MVICITSHFSGWKDICQSDSHLSRLLKSSWSLSQSKEYHRQKAVPCYLRRIPEGHLYKWEIIQGPKLSLAERLKAQEQKKMISLLGQPSKICQRKKSLSIPKYFPLPHMKTVCKAIGCEQIKNYCKIFKSKPCRPTLWVKSESLFSCYTAEIGSNHYRADRRRLR